MPQRIFYASHAVEVNGTTVPGAQSVGVNTNFNLEQVFQLGKIAVYDNLSVDPEVEVTINKALDGRRLIWSLARGNQNARLDTSANDTSDIQVGVGDDINAVLAANTSTITMTGCFVNSLNYTFPVEGNFTEEVTFVGSHKSAAGAVVAPVGDAPLAGAIVGHVLRRQNFQIAAASNLPVAIAGKKLSSVSISTSFNREKMFTLGQFSPYHRFVNFPIEVTVTFDVIAQNIGISASLLFDTITAECEGRPYDKEHINLALCDSLGDPVYTFDLGSGCSLQSVNYSGGDTGGGNVTETYTYISYNELTITDLSA